MTNPSGDSERMLLSRLFVLCVFVAFTVLAGEAALVPLKASPGHDGGAPHLDDILTFAVVGIGVFTLEAILLRTRFRQYSAWTAVALLVLSATLSATLLCALTPLPPGDVGTLSPDRVTAMFALFCGPGLTIALLLYAALTVPR